MNWTWILSKVVTYGNHFANISQGDKLKEFTLKPDLHCKLSVVLHKTYFVWTDYFNTNIQNHISVWSVWANIYVIDAKNHLWTPNKKYL